VQAQRHAGNGKQNCCSDAPEQVTRHRDPGHPEHGVAGVGDKLRTDLDQLSACRGRDHRSVRRAEKRERPTKMMHVRLPTRPLVAGLVEVGGQQGAIHLIRWQTKAKLPSNGMPLGECRLKSLVAAPRRGRVLGHRDRQGRSLHRLNREVPLTGPHGTAAPATPCGCAGPSTRMATLWPSKTGRRSADGDED
jgi:hypothetical protein